MNLIFLYVQCEAKAIMSQQWKRSAVLRPPPCATHLRLLRALGDAGDAGFAEFVDGVDHDVGLVQLLHLVAAADALSEDHDVGDGPSASRICEDLLQLRANGVLVELDDVGLGVDVVLFEEDVLCLSRVRAV